MTTRDLIKILNFYGRFTPSYTRIGYIGRGLFVKNYTSDFTGQRWLITGASGGIGKAIMLAAAEAGAEVIAVARSEEKLKAAMAELRGESAARASYEVADMSLQSHTQALLDRLAQRGDGFDVLINNVGVLFNEMTLTSEGREATFTTNLLSHYLLTEGLIDKGLINEGAAVINMTSGGMYNAPIGIDNLNVTDSSRYHGKVAYGAHKRGQAVLTGYWNGKYGSRGISFYVTHPGWTRTQGVKDALPVFYKIQSVLLRSPYQGGETALWLAATRPPTNDDPDGGVWFDHRYKPAHMFEFTKKSRCSVDEFVAFLDAELGKGRAGEHVAA